MQQHLVRTVAPTTFHAFQPCPPQPVRSLGSSDDSWFGSSFDLHRGLTVIEGLDECLLTLHPKAV
jgi:hypothetical protein